MQTNKTLRVVSQDFLLLSALSLLAVSIMAFCNPHAVMKRVNVRLTDAFGSIRGVYGGVGLTLFIRLLHLLGNDTQKGLLFLCLLWGSYALSRTITLFVEGALSAFGSQWQLAESTFFIVAFPLWLLTRKSVNLPISR